MSENRINTICREIVTTVLFSLLLPTLLADESKTGQILLFQVTYPLTQLCLGELTNLEARKLHGGK